MSLQGLGESFLTWSKLQGERWSRRQRAEFEFQVFPLLPSWASGKCSVQINVQVPFLPGPGSLTNHAASFTFRGFMAQPLIYEEDVTTLYPQQGRGSLRSRPWREEEDFHMQKTPISPRPVSDPLGPQLDSQPDLQFISPQPSTGVKRGTQLTSGTQRLGNTARPVAPHPPPSRWHTAASASSLLCGFSWPPPYLPHQILMIQVSDKPQGLSMLRSA